MTRPQPKSCGARIRAVLGSALRLLLGLGTGAALMSGVFATGPLVREHSYFSVREIEIRGNDVLGRDTILAAAGLREGMSIWAAGTDTAEARIEALARVQRARVWREFPNRVRVTLTERQAQAIAVLEGLQYVDRSGRVLGPVRAGDSLNFPFITGMDGSHLGGAGSRVLRRALRLARLCERRRCGGGVSEVHLDPDRGPILVPRSVPVPTVVGWGGWRRKLDRLSQVLAIWEGQEEQLAVIDVSLRRSAVVRVHDWETGAAVKANDGLQI